MVYGFGFRVKDLGCMVQGLRRVDGAGFRAKGLELRA